MWESGSWVILEKIIRNLFNTRNIIVISCFQVIKWHSDKIMVNGKCLCTADTLFPGRLNQPQYVNAIGIQRGMQMRCIILQKGINWNKFVIKIFIVKKYWNQNYFCLPNIQKLRDDDGWSFESNRLWTLLWISYYDQVWTLLWISCYNQV